MSSSEEPPRDRGLPSIQEARELRRAGKHRWPSVKFWGYSGLILAIGAILNWKWSQGELESSRAALMARQRAVAHELAPRWVPLRDKVERWTVELGKPEAPDVVDKDALAKWDFRDRAGIYLRLRVDEAQTVESIRAGAKSSLRDGFTACLMRVPNPNPLAGRECKHTRDCPAGELCNENDHCSRAAQPFNLRIAYRTMHVLSDEWVRDVQETTSELRLRLFVKNFDDTILDGVPLAADFLQRAQYLLLVLDEAAPGAAPVPLPASDADAGASAGVTEALQAVPHQARVGVWRIADDKLILRVRREAGGQLLGARPITDKDVLGDLQRQANSCALALAVRQAMGDTLAATAPPQ